MKNIVRIEPPVGQRYFAAGKTVRKHPIETHYDDGTSGITMGHAVCEVDSHIVDPQSAAAAIAALLNEDEMNRTGQNAKIPA